MQQLESDLDVTQEKLMNANQRLERRKRLFRMLRVRLPLSTVALPPLKRISKSQKRGCSPPHKSWTWQQPPVTILNVCAKYSRTKPCQMKPEWNPR